MSREVDPGNASLLFNTSVVYVVLVIRRVSVFMDGIIKSTTFASSKYKKRCIHDVKWKYGAELKLSEIVMGPAEPTFLRILKV